MIDLDKVKAAFAANPNFCQASFYEPPRGSNPAALCAISALVSYAGMHPDLIGKFCATWNSFAAFSYPILDVEYRIPEHVASRVPELFDGEENEWKGVSAVLALFERHNEEEAAKPALMPLTTSYLSQMFKSVYESSWKSVQYLTWGAMYEKDEDKWGAFDLATGEAPKLDDAMAKSGEVLTLAARFLGTDGIAHPASLVEPPPAFVLLSMSPDQQIITKALTLADVKAGKIEQQPQLVGAVTEWS